MAAKMHRQLTTLSGAGDAGLCGYYPQPIMDKINAQVNAILKEKEVQDFLESQGADPAGGSAQDYARVIRNNYEMWRPVIQRANVQAD
jgi:tripartite-type tricarboxylate transporter receptor subunit TctC